MRAEIKDFSGGITDFIYTDDISCSEVMDNLNITKDRGIEARDGSRVIEGFNNKPITSINLPQELIEFEKQKFFIYGGEILRYDNGTWEKILGPNTLFKPLNLSTTNSSYSYFTSNKHLHITDDSGSRSVKIYKDGSGNFKLVTAGLPKLASSPVITAGSSDAKSYVYTFIYSFTYTVGESTFIDKSAPVQVQITNASNFSVNPNIVTAIPVLANTTSTQYDTLSITIEVYRTIDAGTTSYLVKTLSNGTTSFNDTMTDAIAQTKSVLYTDGGISDNDAPPIVKHVEICNTCGYYANTVGAPYRLYQSQIGDPDAAPATYYLDFEEEILKVIAYQSNLLVFTENQLWRVEGTIELDGSGEQRRVLVEDKVGYIGGAIRADGGIYFCGYNSFMFTDGYQCKKIPSEEKNIPQRYKQFALLENKIAGTFDRVSQRVMWAVKNSVTDFPIYVYDMAYNSLTTWSGQAGSFSTISLLGAKNGDIYRGDSSGYIFKFSTQYYDDPIVDLSKNSDDWENYPVIYRWKHIAFDFSASDINKWITKVTLSGNGQTNLDIQVNSYDDSTSHPKELTPISFTSNLVWGDENWIWENHNDIWELEKRFTQTRRFPSGKIRCKRKQLEITNAIINIAQSHEDIPNSRVVVDSLLKMATVIDSSAVYVPLDCVDDTIYINEQAFTIVESNPDTFKLKDEGGLLVNGTYHWYMKGVAQQQRVHLSSVIFSYDMLDDRGGYYSAKATDNA
jgi:hypothetical protein